MNDGAMPSFNEDEVYSALATVDDPEIGLPITELDMVEDVTIDGTEVNVKILLTTAGCPLKDHINREVSHAIKEKVPGVTFLGIEMGVMNARQRQRIGEKVRGTTGGRDKKRPASPGGGEVLIPFAQADSKTRVITIASGKGGVGKSSVTANLAVALAKEGAKVGVLDADVWGYSMPRMLGIQGAPVQLEGMVMPLVGHGVKVISIGFFIEPDSPIIWRGPMLHRALQQFFADVHWGDLDVLLVDLPPGTGDIALSAAQLVPNADMLIVTTPQQAAQKVAQRAGMMTASGAGMKVLGVIENMATFVAPDTGVEYDIFGSGGGKRLAETLGTELWASIPIDPRVREGSDLGIPIVVDQPNSVAAQRFKGIAKRVMGLNKKSIIGGKLPVF